VLGLVLRAGANDDWYAAKLGHWASISHDG
jgi:hypothetical protein